jgi:hypothetical protein
MSWSASISCIASEIESPFKSSTVSWSGVAMPPCCRLYARIDAESDMSPVMTDDVSSRTSWVETTLAFLLHLMGAESADSLVGALEKEIKVRIDLFDCQADKGMGRVVVRTCNQPMHCVTCDAHSRNTHCSTADGKRFSKTGSDGADTLGRSGGRLGGHGTTGTRAHGHRGTGHDRTGQMWHSNTHVPQSACARRR